MKFTFPHPNGIHAQEFLLSSNWNIAGPINYTTSGKDENWENLRQMKQVVAR